MGSHGGLQHRGSSKYATHDRQALRKYSKYTKEKIQCENKKVGGARE